MVAVVTLVPPLPSDSTLPDEAACNVDRQSHQHEHERGGPRELDLVLERHPRKVVDENGQRRGGLHEAWLTSLEEPVAAEERGEEERRRLARRPRHREHDAR